MGVREAAGSGTASYLIHATNEIVAIVDGLIRGDSKQINTAFQRACNTLKRLSKDELFFNRLEEAIAKRSKNEAEYRDAIQNVQHFNDHFLPVDAKIMSDAGMSQAAILLIFSANDQLREAMVDPEADVETILARISVLRDTVCDNAQRAASDLMDEQQHAGRILMLKKAAFVAGGAAIFMVNGLSIAATLSPIGVGLSEELGIAAMAAGTAVMVE